MGGRRRASVRLAQRNPKFWAEHSQDGLERSRTARAGIGHDWGQNGGRRKTPVQEAGYGRLRLGGLAFEGSPIPEEQVRTFPLRPAQP